MDRRFTRDGAGTAAAMPGRAALSDREVGRALDKAVEADIRRALARRGAEAEAEVERGEEKAKAVALRVPRNSSGRALSQAKRPAE